MTISLKHAKESTIPDGTDTDLVLPSDWNAEHVLLQATARILGRISADVGATEELTKAQVLTFLNVEDGATGDLTASEILALLLTVDGAGTGLDADLLDGIQSTAFALLADLASTANGDGASLVGIEDSGGLYAAGDVEAALAEVMTDVDTLETQVSQLTSAVTLQGTWDASSGSFPGSGTAQAGHSYIVTVAGTVDSVEFNINDRILAITNNASTSTYAANWLKLDYTDEVLSVDGLTGAVSLTSVYEPLNADILKADEGDVLTAGYTSDSYSGGTITSGTYTPAPATGQENFQHIVNGGAFTLAPPASVCTVILEIVNNGSAGAITTSGFDVVDGDAFDTTDTNAFMCFIAVTENYSYLNVKAMQ